MQHPQLNYLMRFSRKKSSRSTKASLSNLVQNLAVEITVEENQRQTTCEGNTNQIVFNTQQSDTLQQEILQKQNYIRLCEIQIQNYQRLIQEKDRMISQLEKSESEIRKQLDYLLMQQVRMDIEKQIDASCVKQLTNINKQLQERLNSSQQDIARYKHKFSQLNRMIKQLEVKTTLTAKVQGEQETNNSIHKCNQCDGQGLVQLIKQFVQLMKQLMTKGIVSNNEMV